VVRLRTVEPAKPAVGEVQVDLLAQAPLRANAEAVADKSGSGSLAPDQLKANPPRCNRVCELAPYPVELDKSVDRSQ
jgi:hypothetical protein